MEVRVSQSELVDRFSARSGTIVLLGGIDTGKTTFGIAVAEAARSQGRFVVYIDSDVGQSTIGPPTCIGLKSCRDLSVVDRETIKVADELAFVGSTTPENHILPQVVGTTRLVHHAREAGADLIILDTSGMISGMDAEMLKYYKLELIRPEVVVGFQRGGELDPVLGVVSRFLPVEVVSLKVESAVVERSVEERLAYREERFRAYFQPPLSRWRLKTSIFMPTLPPATDLSKIEGLVVGLEDGKGTCTGIGLLEYDRDENFLRMVSPVTESARGLRLGSLRISSEGKILGRVSIADLFGQV